MGGRRGDRRRRRLDGRRRDVGRGRARRRLARPLGVALVALRAGTPSRASTSSAAGRATPRGGAQPLDAAVERRRLREQRRAAGRRHGRLVARAGRSCLSSPSVRPGSLVVAVVLVAAGRGRTLPAGPERGAATARLTLDGVALRPELALTPAPALGRSHEPDEGTARRDALRLHVSDDRRVLDEEHARPADDRLLRRVREACAAALDGAVPRGSLPRSTTPGGSTASRSSCRRATSGRRCASGREPALRRLVQRSS